MDAKNGQQNLNETARRRRWGGTMAWIVVGVVALALVIGWFARTANESAADLTSQERAAQMAQAPADPSVDIMPDPGALVDEPDAPAPDELAGDERSVSGLRQAAGSVDDPFLVGTTTMVGAADAETALSDAAELDGQTVRVRAEVDEVYGNGVFSIKINDSLVDNSMLVVMSGMGVVAGLAEGSQVVVEGVVQDFTAGDADELIAEEAARSNALEGHRDEKMILVSSNLTN